MVQKSELLNPFFKFRIDPEFFQKDYKDKYEKIYKRGATLLGGIAFVSDGEHGNAATFENGYSKYYGARNVLSGILTDNSIEFISKEHHERLKKSALESRDILVSCVGANVGFASIVPDDIGIANIVRNVALIRSTSSDFYNEYLLTYFLSSYGKNLYVRMNTGNAQPLVSLDYIKTIPVFKASLIFQKTIRIYVEKSLTLINQSGTSYKRAEKLLLETLGMANFSPSAKKVNIKSFKDSFAATSRLDAEYYQPRFEEYNQRPLHESLNLVQKA